MSTAADDLPVRLARPRRRDGAGGGRAGVRMRDRGVEVAGTKSSPTDVVTEADRASEELIRERLLGARPDDGFIGEESATTRRRTSRPGSAGSWTPSTAP